jgi:aminocarboxymuconate-semialdehyde decarboxylase
MCCSESESDISARIEMMDVAGVDMQLLSAVPQLPFFERADEAAAAARFANDMYAELVSKHSDRFLALAALPLPHLDESIAELERAMSELGMLGACASTTVLDRWIADPHFEPVFEALDEREAIFYIHPAGLPDAPSIRDNGLVWVIGAPIEQTTSLVLLMRSGFITRYRRIRFLISHLGGTTPFVLRRLDDNFEYYNAPFSGKPSELARDLWYDTANFHGPSLACACESLGVERLILGSDFPYFRDELYTRAVTYIERSGIDAAAVRAILDENGAALVDSVPSRVRG